MQTYLPYPDFAASARALDPRRLGSQRVEALQVLRALTTPGYGWRHHPAVLMWRGHPALGSYGVTVCRAWFVLGFADSCELRLREELARVGVAAPRPRRSWPPPAPCRPGSATRRCTATSPTWSARTRPSTRLFPTCPTTCRTCGRCGRRLNPCRSVTSRAAARGTLGRIGAEGPSDDAGSGVARVAIKGKSKRSQGRPVRRPATGPRIQTVERRLPWYRATAFRSRWP